MTVLGAYAWRQITIPRNGLHRFFTFLSPERDLLEGTTSPLSLSKRRPGKSKPGEQGALCLMCYAASISHLPFLGSEASI